MTPAEIIAAAEAKNKPKAQENDSIKEIQTELEYQKNLLEKKKSEIKAIEEKIEKLSNELLKEQIDSQVEYDRENFDEVKGSLDTETHSFSEGAQSLFERMDSGEIEAPIAFDL